MNFSVYYQRLMLRAPLLLLAPLVFALVWSGCGNGVERAELQRVESSQFTPVRVIKPSSQATSGESRLTAALRSKNEATLSAKTTGQIMMLDVRVGDRVKKGQALVRLDTSMAAISLQNAKAAERLAQANLTNAKAEHERAKTLHGQGALSDANFDKLGMALDIAAAQADQARAAIRGSSQQISDATIVAPFAGVISARYGNPGNTVSGMPPTPVLSVVDPDNLEVRMAVPEALMPMLEDGSVLPATASPSGLAFEVRVSALGVTVDPMTRTVEVLADVVKPMDPSLKPGALVTVDLFGSKAMTGLFLPSAAIHEKEGESMVYVLVQDKLQTKKVKTSPIRPGTVLVTEGLTPQDVVALDAADIVPGQSVRPLQQ